VDFHQGRKAGQQRRLGRRNSGILLLVEAAQVNEYRAQGGALHVQVPGALVHKLLLHMSQHRLQESKVSGL